MAGLCLVIGRGQVYVPAGSAGISSRRRLLGQSKRLCTQRIRHQQFFFCAMLMQLWFGHMSRFP